jgi:transposase-like protein
VADTKRSLWDAAEAIATLFMGAATTARARMLAHASPLIRLLGQRDALCHENSLLERELEVFRSQRQRKAPHQRPHYAPEERARILEVMRLRGWTVKQAAQRFVVHPNTIRNWRRAVEDRTRSDRLLGRPPWNRLHDGVRGVVLELRRAFPEPEFGTRTIARHLVRAGIRISRTSVRRVLQEHQGGPRTRGEHARRVTQPTHHIRHPVEPNRVWHLDLTEIRVLWLTVTLAAIVDGFTRKIVALRASRARPTSEDLSVLVAEAIVQAGRRPRFLVTDHGSQFRRRFTANDALAGHRPRRLPGPDLAAQREDRARVPGREALGVPVVAAARRLLRPGPSRRLQRMAQPLPAACGPWYLDPGRSRARRPAPGPDRIHRERRCGTADQAAP